MTAPVDGSGGSAGPDAGPDGPSSGDIGSTPPAAPGLADPGRRLASWLDGWWDRYTGWSTAVVVAVLVGLTVFRSGVGSADQELGSWTRITRAFPTPVPEWRSNSILGPALGRVVGVETPSQWVGLHAVLVAGLVVLVGLVVSQRFATRDGRRMALAWLALGSVAPVLLEKLGSYDPFTAAGALLVVFGRRRAAVVVGGALLGATSAEQGIIGLVAALAMVVSLAPRPSGRLDRRAVLRSDLVEQLVLGAVSLLVARVLVLAFFAAQGTAVPSRGSVFGELLGDSLANAGAAGGAGVYAWLGIGWALLLLGWASQAWGRTAFTWVVVSLVALPAAATVTTLDGTRVFAMVSLPAVLVLLGWVVDRVESGVADGAFARRVTTACLLVSPLVPALITDPSGRASFVFPWGG